MRIIGRASRVATLSDSIFDGEPVPREIRPENWLLEGAVHKARVLTRGADSTRHLAGPQVPVLRDDNRRVSWAGYVENGALVLHKIGKRHIDRQVIAENNVWRFHLALDKFLGRATAVWVTTEGAKRRLFLDGVPVETASDDVDFPFFEFSQVPVGHVATSEPAYGLLAYKCRSTGAIFARRVVRGQIEPERRLEVGPVVGGITFGIFEDRVIARVDRLEGQSLVPALLESSDGGRTFGAARDLDLGDYRASLPSEESDVRVAAGYTQPIVDKGGDFHIPIIASNAKESFALNYVLRENALVEAIRVAGKNPAGHLEVFPSTVGSKNSYGNGISDGHGLIMVLETEGKLYSSNSSAGGIHFPDARLLNHDMPLIRSFAPSACYSSGLKDNVVSMDYLFFESDPQGRILSPELYFETWDMPLPLPQGEATSRGSAVEVRLTADADFEPGKVMFGFDDPTIEITEVKIGGMRSATVSTNADDLAGKTLTYDVLTLFHRHHGQIVITAG